jgi:hypothetical protein
MIAIGPETDCGCTGKPKARRKATAAAGSAILFILFYPSFVCVTQMGMS